MLAKALRRAGPALIFSEHLEGADGAAMFEHACRLGPRGHHLKAHHVPLQVGAVHRLGEGEEPGL